MPVLFIKAFTADDVRLILSFVRNAAGNNVSGANTVLFVDTPITSQTVEATLSLKREGFRVVFRDHHGIEGEPRSDRDRQVIQASAKLQQVLGGDCTISVRSVTPACSALVAVGEFRDALAIIADPDPDGLTAAMKAAGIYYPELDEDAAKLDGEPFLQVTGSPVSQLLAKGVAILPSFDPQRPSLREEATKKLFMDWVAAVQGDERARARLQAKVAEYDDAVRASHSIAKSAVEVAPGVVLADVSERPFFDPGTLTHLLEQRPGCKVAVLRKGLGPIAAVHGIQYSLSVAKGHQDTLCLQRLVPSDAKSDPQIGIISNVSFLLHVSEPVWQEVVLPQLQSPGWGEL